MSASPSITLIDDIKSIFRFPGVVPIREARQIQTDSDFQCPGEGFYPDPTECESFYRCILNGASLTAIKFQCGPGTVFDPATSSCNYPYASGREECGGNSIDGNYALAEEGDPSSSTTSTTSRPTSRPGNVGTVCTKEGFLGDPNNCFKFYRCVANGNGFIRYDFNCAPGTAWDVKTENCNFPSESTCGGAGGGSTWGKINFYTKAKRLKVNKRLIPMWWA